MNSYQNAKQYNFVLNKSLLGFTGGTTLLSKGAEGGRKGGNNKKNLCLTRYHQETPLTKKHIRVTISNSIRKKPSSMAKCPRSGQP